MKAISLWQPWASLIGRGKSIETRSWATNYRGPLLIHAAKRWTMEQEDLCFTPRFRSALWPYLCPDEAETNGDWVLEDSLKHLPFGAIVAQCRLVDCLPTERFYPFENGDHKPGHRCYWDGNWWVNPSEIAFGDYGRGRWAWMLEDIRILPEPIPYRGAQGLFDVADWKEIQRVYEPKEERRGLN